MVEFGSVVSEATIYSLNLAGSLTEFMKSEGLILYEYLVSERLRLHINKFL